MKKQVKPLPAILAVLIALGVAFGIMYYVDSRPPAPLPVGPSMGGGGGKMGGGGGKMGGAKAGNAPPAKKGPPKGLRPDPKPLNKTAEPTPKAEGQGQEKSDTSEDTNK